MTVTLADKEALERALLRGERSVMQGDKRVEYRDVAEIERALAYVNAELERQAPSAERKRIGYVQFNRGLER